MSRMKSLLLLVYLFLLGVPEMRADAALLLEEPYGNFGAMNPTGHAAVYLSRICAETPTRLRRCIPGEVGVVLSRYHHIAGYDWIAIPLIPYLYAVEQPNEVPKAVDASTVAFLRDSYRRNHLWEIMPDEAGGQTPKGTWGQLIGAAYDRKIFGFEIETTEAQDDQLIAILNSGSNKSHFNLLLRNCADFARGLMNTYYPGALHRSLIADAGITTPKQIAKSIVNYSEHHPELRFSAFIIPQVQGTIPRSKVVHGVFESLMKSKKYVLPLAALHPWLASGMFAAYLARGRFGPSHEADGYYGPHELLQHVLVTQLDVKGMAIPRELTSQDSRPASVTHVTSYRPQCSEL
jgi:hypothetical protein